MKRVILALILVSVSVMVRGHTEHNDTGESAGHLGLGVFMLIIGIVALVIVGFMFFLYKTQSRPNSLPLRSITIAISVTYILNVILFGYFYLEV